MMNKTMTKVGVGVAAVAALGIAALSMNSTQVSASKHPAAGKAITKAEVLEAQRAWVAALAQISSDYEAGGLSKAQQTAEAVLDGAYGYNLGPVLFKPTLAVAPQTFRSTRDGALAYFVGGNPAFPNDSGFALKGWTGGEMVNDAVHLNGNVAIAMGNVTLQNKDGTSTTVDKTFGYTRDEQGNLRIVLHHSSLPFQP